ncbi:MAG TPA: hypothetical protein DCE23_04575 [Firmicutes bacterium]|nr:hypothetical protein [Bacillota bacterium]
MKLTYKFNNDEKQIEINHLEYLDPKDVLIYIREGDSLYVNDGDYVYVNQLIKEGTNGIKSYATVSGTIKISKEYITINNDKTDSNLISAEARENLSGVKKEDIINSCESLGIDYENRLIVNKLKTPSKILIINAMDVEPYQFNNNYLFQDNVTDLLDTAKLLAEKFNIETHLLLNKYDDNNVDAVKRVISKYPEVNFRIINDVFPYNTNPIIANKFFKEYKKEDILFLDTFALYKIFVAIKNGLPVNERYITVNLGRADSSYVIKAKYGSNLAEIIKECIKIDPNEYDIYLNNFMRKIKCDNLESLIITDNIKGIFLFPKDENVSSKCIKCGKCVDICPVNINPLSKTLDSSCIRCGLCNFVCPANINLLSKENKEKEI